jgi:hypothetical protein
MMMILGHHGGLLIVQSPGGTDAPSTFQSERLNHHRLALQEKLWAARISGNSQWSDFTGDLREWAMNIRETILYRDTAQVE